MIPHQVGLRSCWPTWWEADMRHLAIFLISIYQKTLSPDHGFFRVFFPYGFCRYYPSCSEYMRQSIFKYGFFIGIFRGLIRLLRCNPWTRG